MFGLPRNGGPHARTRASARREAPSSGLPELPEIVQEPPTLWRYRRRWGPPAALLGLWSLSDVAHAFAPREWRLALAGLVPTGLAVLRMDRRIERVFVASVGLGATAWLAATWAAGAGGWGGWLLAAGSGVALAAWWSHVRVRGNLVYDRTRLLDLYISHGLRGAAWRAPLTLAANSRRRRRARRTVHRHRRNWPWVASSPGINLYGSEITGGGQVGETTVLHLHLGPAQVVDDVKRLAARLESALDVHGGVLRVEEGAKARQCVLRIVPPGGHQPILPWPGSSTTSIKQGVTLGEFEGGAPVLVPLVSRETGSMLSDWLIAGLKRWGKSGILNVILATLAGCRDVVLWGIDPKGGVELGPWARLMARLADSPLAAEELLAAALAEMHRRLAVMRERGVRVWDPSPETPAIVLVIDEAARLTDTAKGRLEELVAMCGAAGMMVIVCTQRPSAAKLGGTGDLRSQLGVQISLKLRDSRDAEMVFGDGAARHGWRPDTIEVRGCFLIRSEDAGYLVPRRAQAYWLSDAEVRATVERHARVRSQPSSEPTDARPTRIDQTPPPEPVTRPAEAPGPALRVLPNEPADAAPIERLYEALREATRTNGGAKIAELAERTERSGSWVYATLPLLEAKGLAQRVMRGWWRAVESPSVRLVKEDQDV